MAGPLFWEMAKKKAMLEHLPGNWDSNYFKYISKINILNDDIIKSKLPAYRQLASIKRNKLIHEGPLSALTAGMKVNNCKTNPTQGIDHSDG